LLALARGPRKSAHIPTYRAKSRQIAKFTTFAPLRLKPMPCGHRKSVDQNQGLLIWRADLAENKEAKVRKTRALGRRQSRR
jgi:hypothetical protein